MERSRRGTQEEQLAKELKKMISAVRITYGFQVPEVRKQETLNNNGGYPICGVVCNGKHNLI